jgi:hypothetical protein
MNDEFYFHKRIDFDILKKTPKAMLIQVLGIDNSGKTMEILNFYGRKIMEPMEIWVPKSWIKLDYEQEPWIWEEGFLKNLKALGEKRKKFLIDKGSNETK